MKKIHYLTSSLTGWRKTKTLSSHMFWWSVALLNASLIVYLLLLTLNYAEPWFI